MKAIVFDRFGAPADVLKVKESPRPEPGPGEVRVRMTCAPINPSDIMVVRGQYGRLPTLPATPGFEGCGVVDAAGPGWLASLRRLKPGKRVAVLHGQGGSWAEYAVVSAKELVPMPDSIPDDQAAAFFVNPATALVMVNYVLKVRPGTWLLQTAAASSLGRMIIRLAKHQGFKTINLVRRADAVAELKKLGADEVIVTNSKSVEDRVTAITGGAKVDYALDCVGGTTGLEAAKCLAPGGRLLLYGTLSGEPIPLPSRILMAGSKSIEGFWLSDWVKTQGPLKMLALFRQITKLIEAGVLATPVEATYGLDQIRDAINHAERQGRTGKILLKMGGPSTANN